MVENKKKKELSNQEINLKYDRVLNRLKRKVNALGKSLKAEELKLRDLLLNHNLNETNHDLLETYIASLKKLEQDLIFIWEVNMKRID